MNLINFDYAYINSNSLCDVILMGFCNLGMYKGEEFGDLTAPRIAYTSYFSCI